MEERQRQVVVPAVLVREGRRMNWEFTWYGTPATPPAMPNRVAPRTCTDCGAPAYGHEFRESGLCQTCLHGPLPTKDTT